jgi:hypothetical protein
MVNDETAKELIGYVKEGNKALIVLGDYCQPVPTNRLLFFENISSELTIPMRFQGPLYYLVNLIRTEIKKCVLG